MWIRDFLASPEDLHCAVSGTARSAENGTGSWQSPDLGLGGLLGLLGWGSREAALARAPGCHRHSSGERPRSESSASPSGMRGSSAERVSPQNLGGDSSFLVAVNFQPMWLPQILHWAMVQAYLQSTAQPC